MRTTANEEPAYRPMLSAAAVRQRIAWQQRVYERNSKRRKAIWLDFYGTRISVLSQVFVPGPPKHNLLARAIRREVQPGDRVLDMGTGSGIQAILAASQGAKVVAVDINPHAVRCAKSNVMRNGFASTVKVVQSDLFARVKGKFDLILFDPPFRWTEPRDWLEYSSADKGYKTLQSFFSNVRNYLAERGAILITFGTSGDLRYFRHLVRQHRFTSRRLLTTRSAGWEYFLYKLKN